MSVLLEAVRDPGIHTVLVAGEAGIGKSRLVGEFTERLGRDALVLIGRCPELGTGGVAFAPFLAVLRALVRQLGVQAVAALLPPRPALSNWLPQLAVHTGGAAVDADRVRLFGEILTVLEQSALTRPVIVALEDLHWADDASRELLTFLAANLADADALLVGTYRPGEAGPLRGLVAELRRNPGVRVLDLHPLTRHEVGRQLAALLGREPEPALITMVFERSGGNPLFVEALGQAPGRMPADLADLLLGFATGLDPVARTVVRAAAVIGSPIRHELLAAAVRLPDDELHTGLRELVDRHLLLTTGTGYEFRHVLIRQALHDDLLPAERLRLHTHITEVLSARTDSTDPELLGQLAHHAEAAGQLDKALTAAWSAASAVPATHPERLRLLEQVSALWDRVPAAATALHTTKLAVLEQIVDVASASGATEHGIAAADAALALIDTAAAATHAAPAALGGGDVEGEAAVGAERMARLLRRRAYLRATTGAGPGEDLARALALLPADPPSLERAEALVQSAAIRIFQGDAEGTAAAAGEALAIAEQFESDTLRARAHAHLGLAGSHDIDGALARFEAARRAAVAAADPRIVVDVATWESAVLVGAGRYRAAIESVQRGLRAAHESFRFAEAAPILLVKWAQALTALGRWDEARAVVDDTEFESMPPLSRAALLLCFGRIGLAQGDTDRVENAVAVARRLLGESRWALQYRLELAALISESALYRNHSRTAVVELTALSAGPQALATLSAHPHEAWPLLVLAVRIPGAPPELVALADSLLTTSPVDAAYRAVFTAHLTGSAARWSDAATAWRDLERPYDEAASLLGLAETAAAEGDLIAAETALRSAADIATRLDAVPLREAAAQLAEHSGLLWHENGSPVRRLSAETARRLPGGASERAAAGASKVQGDSASGRYGLTPRELEVLRLVAKGLSNRGLAAELFISANTAGVHVSRILAKLGVASRTEAAAFAHQHELLGARDGSE